MTPSSYDVILDPLVVWDATKLGEPLRFLRESVGFAGEIEFLLANSDHQDLDAESTANGSGSQGSAGSNAGNPILRLALTDEQAWMLRQEIGGKNAWGAGIIGFRSLSDDHPPSHPPGSITVLIEGIKQGDEEAMRKALDRVRATMANVAAQSMRVHDPMADEEDMIYCAFASCVLGIAKGRYDLRDRSELFRLLATIIRNNCRDHDRRALAAIRDRNRLVDLARQHAQRRGVSHEQAMQEIAGKIATPDIIASFEEGVRVALQKLSDSEWIVAVMRLRGHSNREIAEELGVSERTVERKLSDVRKVWRKLI